MYLSRLEAEVEVEQVEGGYALTFHTLAIETSGDDADLEVQVDTSVERPGWLGEASLEFRVDEEGRIERRPRLAEPRFDALLTRVPGLTHWQLGSLAARPAVRLPLVHDLDAIGRRFADAVIHEVEVELSAVGNARATTYAGAAEEDLAELGAGEFRLTDLHVEAELAAARPTLGEGT